jgi:hypothetical protein
MIAVQQGVENEVGQVAAARMQGQLQPLFLSTEQVELPGRSKVVGMSQQVHTCI